jgi:DnaK suppressor protein
VTKRPAPKTPAKKPVAGKAATTRKAVKPSVTSARGKAAPVKAVLKRAAPVKVAPKPAPSAKASPKPAPSVKAASKPAPSAKAAPKPATPAKRTAAARALPAPAPEVLTRPPAPAQPVPLMKPAPTPSPIPVAVAVATPASLTKKASRNAAKYGAPAVQAPLPPPTSRFADRFAPPRPPTRQMNNLEIDTPRQAHKADPKLANAWKTKAGRDLTEPEIMAMPEAEYMNDKQLEFFRLKLQTLKDDLLSNAGETTEHLREDTSIVPDPADRATIEEEHALELRTRDRERKLLKKISQSMSRLDSGEYGFCDETGEPIGLGRLIARPTATLSLEAQQRRELKQKMFGD